MSKTNATGWVAKKGRWAINSRVWIGADNPAGPMLERWRLLQTPWFGIYVHFIYREDLDRVPHDHPWTFWTLVLRGGYREQYWANSRLIGQSTIVNQTWERGMLPRLFRQQAAHRISRVWGECTTLVLVGPKSRIWGFYPDADANMDRPRVMPHFVPWEMADSLGLRSREGPAGNRPAGTPQHRPYQSWARSVDIRDGVAYVAGTDMVDIRDGVAYVAGTDIPMRLERP